MALKQNLAMNKPTLAQYTWTETETIAIQGETKDTKVYKVQMMNGQQQKTDVSNQKAQQGGREGRLIIRAKQSANISLQPGGSRPRL